MLQVSDHLVKSRDEDARDRDLNGRELHDVAWVQVIKGDIKLKVNDTMNIDYSMINEMTRQLWRK